MEKIIKKENNKKEDKKNIKNQKTETNTVEDFSISVNKTIDYLKEYENSISLKLN